MRRGLEPRTFLLLGLAAGLLAGLAAFGVAWLVGEPHVDAAIALEEAAATHDHGHSHGEGALVSRTVQSTIGLLTGSLVIATVLGGITGLLAALAMGRLGALRPAGSTAVVAALGFLAVGLVPFLKYPANPPAVGDPGTIGSRTGLYFGFLAASVAATVVSVMLARRTLPYGGYRAVVAGGAAGVALLVLAVVLFPTVDEVAKDFPASLLWHFRISSLLTLATLWGVLGVALTGLVARVAARAQADQQRRELAASL